MKAVCFLLYPVLYSHKSIIKVTMSPCQSRQHDTSLRCPIPGECKKVVHEGNLWIRAVKRWVSTNIFISNSELTTISQCHVLPVAFKSPNSCHLIFLAECPLCPSARFASVFFHSFSDLDACIHEYRLFFMLVAHFPSPPHHILTGFHVLDMNLLHVSL